MTRKDYIKFAAALKENRKVLDYSDSQDFTANLAYNTALDDLASDMCRIFAQDNGNFDRSRFLTASGVQG